VFLQSKFQLFAKILHVDVILADPFAAQLAIQFRSFTKVVRQNAATQSIARLKYRHFATAEAQTVSRRQARKPTTNHHAFPVLLHGESTAPFIGLPNSMDYLSRDSIRII
jgi:hypothetical protein